MQTEHAHHAKTRSRIGDGLWITPDSGHHVEKRLDIVADGFEPRNIIAEQVLFLLQVLMQVDVLKILQIGLQ